MVIFFNVFVDFDRSSFFDIFVFFSTLFFFVLYRKWCEAQIRLRVEFLIA